ncbi:MAG: NAD(P)H-dependent oxidoreductase [Eubacterium sp.]|nr:NAD(P)H-dependent oxidoreductase [Eubacterium sp.]
MDQILFINACVRRQSRTERLARCVLEQLDGDILERKLEREHLQPLDGSLLEKRDRLLSEGTISDEMFRYAREFAGADIIVIGAPYWDMNFPALLKLYLEQIMVCGITFQYSDEGIPKGLCHAKKLIYVTTAGGPVYFNFGFEYVKTLAEQFFGIRENLFFKAENLDIAGNDVKQIMAEAEVAVRGLFPLK